VGGIWDNQLILTNKLVYKCAFTDIRSSNHTDLYQSLKS
jgi:hypothetical protein